jgi:hypothetical protein
MCAFGRDLLQHILPRTPDTVMKLTRMSTGRSKPVHGGFPAATGEPLPA